MGSNGKTALKHRPAEADVDTKDAASGKHSMYAST